MSGSAGAAARLGLKRTTLQALVKRLGIDRPSAQANISAPAE